MDKKTKVLIIGLDGATLDLIKPWAENGLLPNLANIMKNGDYGKLLSVEPVVSAPAWVTFMTGTNPGKHGIYDFVYREDNSYRLRPTNRTHIKTPTLWTILSQLGSKVGVVNVPMTYPPEAVNGFMVSGLGTPNYKTFTYPPELSEELINRGYRVNRKMYYPENDLDGFLEDTFDLIESIHQTTKELISEHPWDLFMVVFRDTDDVSHGFWHYMDTSHPKHVPNSPYQNTILRLYQQLDNYIGELVTLAGDETNVIIMSDHGFGPQYKDVYLNEWLRREGYLATKHVPPQHSAFSKLGITRSNISKWLRKAHLGKVESLIKDILGDKIEILPKTSFPDFSEGIDWEHTKAYSYGYQGQIYINLAGREPHGIVKPGDEYNALINEISQKLMELTDPDDGKPVVDNILRASELYTGDYQSKAPDLVLVMRGHTYITRLGYELGSISGSIFENSPVNETGGHMPDGVLITQGPAFKNHGREAKTAWLGDITPTVLHIMGCPIPDWMDGRVLIERLNSEYAQKEITITDSPFVVSIHDKNALSDEEENEIMKRLSDLGYLN